MRLNTLLAECKPSTNKGHGNFSSPARDFDENESSPAVPPPHLAEGPQRPCRWERRSKSQGGYKTDSYGSRRANRDRESFRPVRDIALPGLL